MPHFISNLVEEQKISTIRSFLSTSDPVISNSQWPASPPEEPRTPEFPESRRKRIRTAPPSPPLSCPGNSPTGIDQGLAVKGHPNPSTPSPIQLDHEASPGIPYLPTPPGSESDEDAEDLLGLKYPLTPRPLSQCRVSPLPTKRLPHDFNFRIRSTLKPQTSYSASPDRYVSNRNTPQDSIKSFRLGKPSHLLSEAEKLLRQDSSTPDPFVSGSPRRFKRGRSLIATNLSRSASRSQSRSVSNPDVLTISPTAVPSTQLRQASIGAVWNVGGGGGGGGNATSRFTGPIQGISDGRGGLFGSGTNAPLYTAKFLEKDDPDDDMDTYEHRLAMALDIDRTRRTLEFSRPRMQGRQVSGAKRKRSDFVGRTQWKLGEWTREGDISPARKSVKKEPKSVPHIPFRVLDAPQLRDDYYCSVLAYCRTTRTLAVGLSNKVYLWSEAFGVQYPRMDETTRRNSYVTSLSFSSAEGGHAILAIGRNSGHISLWSLYDEGTRFESQQPNAVACLAFKPVTTRRTSAKFGRTVSVEELLVGDEIGNVYYYAVEWVENLKVDIHGWHGVMTLIAKISVHSQQICGLAWSEEGEYFATGANDNACCLFVVKDILTTSQVSKRSSRNHRRPLQPLPTAAGSSDGFSSEIFRQRLGSIASHTDANIEASPVSLAQRALSNPFILRAIPGQNGILSVGEGRQKHRWIHSAAIKAIAFCPWQPGLLATGGGSNDRAIHFYHIMSGACLATINVQAQLTSLIWSTSRHEIAATFGYAQPEHPYRIAVFSWPECRQVVAIPWANEMRALHAIAYPGGPNEKGTRAREGEAWWSRTSEEGCIVVACSDESVKFHEVWTGKRKSMGAGPGLLGRSDILESLEGIDKEDKMVIR
ncbi:MAG: hypothetical protein Q9219_003599 [cf. Caloplaca sp. 3 TL-2023]